MFRRITILVALLGTALACRGAELSAKQAGNLERLAQDKFAPRWEYLNTNELGQLRRKVEAYEAELRRNHLVGGLVVSLRYSDTNRTQLVAYEDLADSGTWTGFYLASLSMRYVVERRPATLDGVREVLGGIERLLQSSGRIGYLPRFAGLGSDPAFKAVYSRYGGEDPKRPGFGRWAFPGTNGLVWLAGPSRETYSGINLGLALTHQFIREVGIRQRVSNIVEQILTRIEKDGGRLQDGQGQQEFLTPLLEAALLRTGASVLGRDGLGKYEKAFELLMDQRISDPVGPVLPKYDAVRPYVFIAGELLALNRLETIPNRKTVYQERLSKLWRSAGSELNPWLAGAYVNVDDPRPNDTRQMTVDSAAMAVLQGVLWNYPNPPRWAVRVPLPESRATAPVEANGRKWSKNALPVFSRPVAAFQWTVTGRTLEDAPMAEPIVHPGVDLMLPYWLARNAGIVLPEDLPPLKRASDKILGGRLSPTNAARRLLRTNALPASPSSPAPLIPGRGPKP